MHLFTLRLFYIAVYVRLDVHDHFIRVRFYHRDSLLPEWTMVVDI